MIKVLGRSLYPEHGDGVVIHLRRHVLLSNNNFTRIWCLLQVGDLASCINFNVSSVIVVHQKLHKTVHVRSFIPAFIQCEGSHLPGQSTDFGEMPTISGNAVKGSHEHAQVWFTLLFARWTREKIERKCQKQWPKNYFCNLTNWTHADYTYISKTLSSTCIRTKWASWCSIDCCTCSSVACRLSACVKASGDHFKHCF